MLRVIFAGLFSLSLLASFAQTLTIRGTIADSTTGKGLAYATVSVIGAKDSMLIAFTIADTAGRFRLNKIAPGNYLLSVSYTGYQPVWRPLPPASAAGIVEAGDVALTGAGVLQRVEVTGKRPPVEVNNDTLEFNAENFKTQPNAVVEDMLKKMPGVTVESDGTIKINGQTVRRILVNGKEFFTGDVKMATKNLNADAVDKIQVYDRSSDQAAFTGIDDGNREKTINIKLKKDRNFATFGKVTAGAGSGGTPSGMGSRGEGTMSGSGGRFDGQVNINRFSGDEQLSLLGMGNNTNRQGFTIQDVLNFTGELSHGMRNGGGGIQLQNGGAGDNNGLPVTGLGQSQQGIATTFAGGLNYNNTWDKGKTSLNANYTGSHIRLLTVQQSLTQNVAADNYNTSDTSNTVQNIMQNRIGAILDQQFDSSFSLRLTPSLTWQHSNKQQLENYASYSLPDSLLLNDGNNNNNTTPGAFYFTTDILLRKRLAKKGRTLSADVNVSYNHSTQGATQISDNTFYPSGSASGGAPTGASPTDSNINQIYNRNALTRSLGGNITYTEPLSRRSLLALTGFYNVNACSSNRLAYNYDSTIRKYNLTDSLLTDNFASNYRYAGGGASYQSHWRKVNLTAGVTLQAAMLDAMNKSSGGSSIRQSFTDLLPSVLLQDNISQTKNLQLVYNTYTAQPSVIQLQPVPDLSNPLDITTGNPALKRSYNHNLTLNYFSAHPASRTDLLFLLSITDVANAIVNSDSVTAVGTRFTTPVNANGVGNIFSNLEYGFPLLRLHSKLELGGLFKYSKNVDFINGAMDNSGSFTLRPEFTYSYTGSDKLDLQLKAAVSFISGRYSLQPALNTHYQRQNYGVNMTQYLPLHLSFHNEFNYIINSGRSNGYNSSIPLWNTWLAKSFLRNDRAELKLGVMDLLDRNTGITRNVNQGSIVDERYNVLQRYFLLSFTYSLNKSGLHPKGGPHIDIRTIGD